MAFDFTKLEGYKPEMTADEKLALLDKYEPPAPDLSGFIAKTAFDKTASELAEAKRQLKAKQTEEERKEAERLETEAAVKAELEELRKENAITKSKAEFLALGYDDVLAADTAKALAEGDMTKVFANQKAHIENVKKAERAAALAEEPKPPAGDGGGDTKTESEKVASQIGKANADNLKAADDILSQYIGGK